MNLSLYINPEGHTFIKLNGELLLSYKALCQMLSEAPGSMISIANDQGEVKIRCINTDNKLGWIFNYRGENRYLSKESFASVPVLAEDILSPVI